MKRHFALPIFLIKTTFCRQMSGVMSLFLRGNVLKKNCSYRTIIWCAQNLTRELTFFFWKKITSSTWAAIPRYFETNNGLSRQKSDVTGMSRFLKKMEYFSVSQFGMDVKMEENDIFLNLISCEKKSTTRQIFSFSKMHSITRWHYKIISMDD